MTIVDLFNPAAIEDIRAFRALQNNGQWPQLWWTNKIDGKDIEIPPSWYHQLTVKISQYYIDHYEDFHGSNRLTP